MGEWVPPKITGQQACHCYFDRIFARNSIKGGGGRGAGGRRDLSFLNKRLAWVPDPCGTGCLSQGGGAVVRPKHTKYVGIYELRTQLRKAIPVLLDTREHRGEPRVPLAFPVGTEPPGDGAGG